MSYLYKTPEGLLPCPHCGGEAEARDGSSTTPYIRCKSCGCRTGSSRNVDRLKEAWNRRAERTCNVESSYPAWGEDDTWYEIKLSCGDSFPWWEGCPPDFCPCCGREVVSE